MYDVTNLGNPLLEAMYCGLPIASIDDGSTAELLQDGTNAFLVPHEKLETELPQKVALLLTDHSVRSRFIQNVKQVFHEKVLSWRDRMLLEHQLIQRLIASPANSRRGEKGR
jgi:glycosyltransferase involved in cell wall biosynthesis